MLEHKSLFHTSFYLYPLDYFRPNRSFTSLKKFLKFEKNITESLLIYVIFRFGYVIMISLKYQKSFFR